MTLKSLLFARRTVLLLASSLLMNTSLLMAVQMGTTFVPTKAATLASKFATATMARTVPARNRTVSEGNLYHGPNPLLG